MSESQKRIAALPNAIAELVRDPVTEVPNVPLPVVYGPSAGESPFG